MDPSEDLGDPALAVTALWELSQRLDSTPSDPWVFFRPGWRWRWRSWAEVADQMARGAVLLGRAAESAPGEVATVAFADRRDPDALVTAMTIRAAGLRPLPVDPEGSLASSPPDPSPSSRWELWAQVASSTALSDATSPSDASGPNDGDEPSDPKPWTGVVDLPAVRSRFETTPLERPPLPPQTGSVSAQVRTLADGLEASSRGLGKRARRPRPILCAGPDLSAEGFQALLMATLATDTAWVLEGDPDLFPAAASWARPTALVATPEHGREVLDALGSGSRRWRRLRRLWLLPASSEDAADGIVGRCSELGVVAEPWPEALGGGLAA